MSSAGAFIIRFYVPLVLALWALVLVIVGPRRSNKKRESAQPLTFSLFGIAGFEIPLPLFINEIWEARLGMAAFAILCVGASFGINLSRYYPRELRMDVFFDLEGIRRTLADIPQNDLTALGLARDWEGKQCDYYRPAIQNVHTQLPELPLEKDEALVEMVRQSAHSRGRTTFGVEKTGFISYLITESSGYLDHLIDVPGRSQVRFRTTFELRETANNHIRPKWSSFLLNPQLVLKPQFRQVLAVDDHRGSAPPADHIVMGVTPVRALPLPEFGDTLYLWQDKTGAWVPVAYAVYY